MTEDTINKILRGEIERASNAGLAMVEAHFEDLLEARGFVDHYAIACALGEKLKELERKGFLVVLRHDASCWHCGARWPRAEGPHVTLCAQCEEKRAALAPNGTDAIRPGDTISETTCPWCKRAVEVQHAREIGEVQVVTSKRREIS